MQLPSELPVKLALGKLKQLPSILTSGPLPMAVGILQGASKFRKGAKDQPIFPTNVQESAPHWPQLFPKTWGISSSP